jgi:aspartyl/glutamyl-tRNA(Asn/Gln) amidotransferase C subunit
MIDITTQDMDRLASLARIEVLPEEKEAMKDSIMSILGYVSQVNTVVEHSKDKEIPRLHNVLREDVVTTVSGEYTQALLDNAPSRDGDYVSVKKIL